MNIIIVDDHPLFRQALGDALEHSFKDVCIEQLSNICDLEKSIEKEKNIDLILLDLQMPDANGFSGYVHVAKQIPSVPIVIVSAHDDNQTIQKVKQLGAQGFISKSSDMMTLSKGVKQVLEGATVFPQIDESELGKDEALEKIASLTQKQYQVFHHCATGMLNKQIAYTLGVTEATVKAHLTTVMRKLGLNNRTQIALLANRFKEVTRSEIKAD